MANKKYLLIPLDSIKECDENEYYHLGWVKSRGEIVESKSIGEFIRETGLKNSDIAIEKFIEENWRLIK